MKMIAERQFSELELEFKALLDKMQDRSVQTSAADRDRIRIISKELVAQMAAMQMNARA